MNNEGLTPWGSIYGKPDQPMEIKKVLGELDEYKVKGGNE